MTIWMTDTAYYGIIFFLINVVITNENEEKLRFSSDFKDPEV